MESSPKDLMLVLIVILLTIVFFLLLRKVFLWYWRINEMVSNQEKTNDLLQKILDQSNKTNPT